MDRALKPNKLEIDKVTDENRKIYLYWEKCFTNYLQTLTSADTEALKLMVLTNNISVDNFSLISDCTTYSEGIKLLRGHYVKETNPLFARHILATRRQSSDETLDEYVSALHELSRKCKFVNVTAEKYREECILYAFIQGIQSSQIRQKILESSNNAELDTVIKLATLLESAQKNSEAFSMNSTGMGFNRVAATDRGNFTPTSSGPLCDFCGHGIHPRSACPANNAVCRRCSRKGHWERMCHARPEQNSSRGSTKRGSFTDRRRGSYYPPKGAAGINPVEAVEYQPNEAAAVYEVESQHRSHDGVMGRNSYNEHYDDSSPYYSSSTNFLALTGGAGSSKLGAYVNGILSQALVDTGAIENYIHPVLVDSLKPKIVSKWGKVSLANGEVVDTPGYVLVNLCVNDRSYNEVKLVILPDAISEVILGRDFQSRHSKVIFQYGGDLPPLVCSLGTLNVEPPALFHNLTLDCHPIAAKSRRYSQADREFIRVEVGRLLGEGIIQRSKSPWRAQVVVTGGRPNQKKRLAIDYSETINRFTLLDAYPLPRIDDTVTKIAQYNVWSTIDLRHAFHQVPICPEDMPYTAFEADGGLYEFTRLPFGVTNGVALFQREMDKFVQVNKLDATVPYLDNVTICGKDQEHHDVNLKKFVEAASRFNLTYNESKCVFSTRRLAILGSVIENGNVMPDPERLRPLQELSPPHNMKSLKRIMGFFAYYSRWIKNFADKIKFLKNVSVFPLSREALDSFQKLKTEVAESALGTIDESDMFTVETDASDEAMGATLNQKGRPVAFFSRPFKGSEMNQASVEKEAQAIIEAVRNWRQFLTGRHFKLVTDQRSVAFMFNAKLKGKIKNEKINRWRLDLSCYNYDIVYRPGRENIPPDTLSRGHCNALAQPKLHELHTALCHPGITRMCHFIKVRNLPYSIEDVKSMTKGCKVCSVCKPQFYRPPDAHLVKATQPFERLNLDFKGPLPSNNKNVYFLQVIDEYSRYPFVYPCSNLRADTIIKCLSDLFSLFGMPMYIHSDRGSSFMSYELKQFLTSKGISTSRTTPYNPRGNGQVEKSNGTIWRAVTMDLKSRGLPQSLWQEVLCNVMHSIRSLLCTATNVTPHERLLGFPRRAGTGTSLPTWLATLGPVLLHRYVRHSKQEPLVDEVDLIEANVQYAHIRHANGREDTVSIRDLAPFGDVSIKEPDISEGNVFVGNDGTEQVMDRVEVQESQPIGAGSAVSVPDMVDHVSDPADGLSSDNYNLPSAVSDPRLVTAPKPPIAHNQVPIEEPIAQRLTRQTKVPKRFDAFKDAVSF